MIRQNALLLSASLAALGCAGAAHGQARLIEAGGSGDQAQLQVASAEAVPGTGSSLSDEASADKAQDIIVTGTRIRGGFSAPTPVTSVGSELLDRRAVTNAGEILAELPSFRQTTSPTQAQRQMFNGGQTNADLRGLGVNRTLTLVNGRRWMPSNFTGTVDTSLLPSNLIDRIDVVTGGASAAYGSDAVAGVVNYILRDRMDGVTGNVQYGISGHGDNKEFSAALAAGLNFADDRAHLVVSGDFAENKGVGTLYSREWSRGAGVLTYPAVRPAGTPNQVLTTDVLYSTITNGSLILSGPLAGTAFGPDGTPFAFQPGTVVGTFMSGGVNPQAYPFGNWPLRTPTKRYSVFGRLTYDLTPDLKAYVEGSYGFNSSKSFTGFNTTTSLTIDISNPYIPPATRTAMLANNLTSITVGRLNTENGGFKSDNEFTTSRFSVGLEGKVFGDWSVDAYYARGRTRSLNVIANNLAVPNLLAAYYVVADGNGNPVCGPIASNPNLTAAQRAIVQPGCVPFNVFGPNRQSAAALDYITDPQVQDVHIGQDVVSANISGSPFSTWAGKVSVATGFEYRTFKVVQDTDRLSQLTAYAFGNPKPFRGSQTVTEGYFEVGVPLLKDSALGKALDLNAAVRRTHYDTSGSVTTWKVGGVYDLNDAIRLRVTRSRDIRAPSPFELFSGGGGFIAATVGVPNPLNNNVTGLLLSTVVVNPALKPEKADTLTAGVVLQPTWSWARGLQVSVDYYDIKINGVIGTPLARDVLTLCSKGDATACSYIALDNSAYGISLVSIPLQNMSRQRTRGIDAEIVYRMPDMGIPGRFDLRAVGTWVLELTDAGGVDRAGWGIGGVPRFTSTVDLNYNLNRFNASVQWRHISSFGFDPSLTGPDNPAYNPANAFTINSNRFPAANYFNLSARYTLYEKDRQRIQVFGIINNLFDKDPPLGATQLLQTGNPYDVIGRTFRFGVRASL